MVFSRRRWALALHGGATSSQRNPFEKELHFLRDLADQAGARLAEGAEALDVVVAAVAALERSGLYVAGKGSWPNADGVFELDAAVMDGAERRAGAVACLAGYESPITAARRVMETTPHVLLAGAGAAQFAGQQGLATIDDPHRYYAPQGKPPAAAAGGIGHGTVGAVARDIDGRLAAATSTGGTYDKRPGRVGDTPLIAAGTWADGRVAVSCTGQGEYFIRAAAAVDVAARMTYRGDALAKAAAGALADMQRQGGEGGLIAVDAKGRLALPYTSAGMKRAWVSDGQAAKAAVR